MELSNEIWFIVFANLGSFENKINFSSCCKRMLFLHSFIKIKTY
jgi:hypothetical protein